MARLADLPWRERVFLAAYLFRRAAPARASPRRPLAGCRVALVTTAGFHLPGDPPFDPSARGGDASLRIIPAPPAGAALRSLGLRRVHRSEAYDPSGIDRDPNLAFPVDRLRELAAEGKVGEEAPRHLSFMGSITAPARLVRESAPRAAEVLLEDRVDAAVLCPV